MLRRAHAWRVVSATACHRMALHGVFMCVHCHRVRRPAPRPIGGRGGRCASAEARRRARGGGAGRAGLQHPIRAGDAAGQRTCTARCRRSAGMRCCHTSQQSSYFSTMLTVHPSLLHVVHGSGPARPRELRLWGEDAQHPTGCHTFCTCGRRNHRRCQQCGAASSSHATGDVPAGSTNDGSLAATSQHVHTNCTLGDACQTIKCYQALGSSVGSHWFVCCARGAAAKRKHHGMPASMVGDPVACSLVEVWTLPVLFLQNLPVCRLTLFSPKQSSAQSLCSALLIAGRVSVTS